MSDFGVITDDTILSVVNVQVLFDADVVVSSVIKPFSGESKVMGGSVVLNPRCRYYKDLKKRKRSLG